MATKNIVPRGNNEGKLGTDEKRWNTVIAETASFTTFSGSITGNEFTLFSGSATSTASFGFLSGDGRGLTNLTATADPAGSDTHVQFNDGGVTGGTAGFTYNKTTNSVTAITNITASGHISSSLTSTASFGRVNATTYSGDGSGLSGVTAGSVTFANVTSKPTLISGSAQISTYVSGAFHNTSSSLATRVTNLKTDSGSFSSRLTTAESELGNALISGSAQIATYVSGAFTDTSSSLATRVTNLKSDSGSFSSRLTTAESELGNALISGSAQIATYVSGAFTDTSSSLATRATNLETDTAADSGSFSTRLTTAESELSNTLISGSAQIATYVSGAFYDASSSLATRVTNLKTDSGSFSSRTSTLEAASSSFSTRVTNLKSDSGSFSSRITNFSTGNFELISGSSTSTGSFGRLEVNASTIAIGGTEINKTVADNITDLDQELGTSASPTFAGLTTTGDITARNYIVSSSVTYMTQSFSSGSTIFGDDITDTHLFTGSLFVSGNLTAVNLTADSSSFSTRTTTLETDTAADSGSFSTRVTNLKSDSGSFSTRTTTLEAASSSFSSRITTAESELSNTLISGSAQISTEISGAFTDVSSSLATRATNLETDTAADSGSFSTRLTTAESELGNTLISGSAQISTYVSGAFTDASSSLATRITNFSTGDVSLVSGSSTSTGSFGLILGDGSQLTNLPASFTAAGISGSFTDASSSLATRATNLETDSGSFSTRITNFSTGDVSLVSGSATSTGSFGYGIVADTLNVPKIQAAGDTGVKIYNDDDKGLTLHSSNAYLGISNVDHTPRTYLDIHTNSGDGGAIIDSDTGLAYFQFRKAGSSKFEIGIDRDTPAISGCVANDFYMYNGAQSHTSLIVRTADSSFYWPQANQKISGSSTSTGSFGHIMKGGVNWDTAVSASAATAGFGGGGDSTAAGTVSGSAQLASAISGAFHDTSSSLATRATNLETDSGSFSTRTTNLETDSGSFSTRITNFSTGGFELISGSASSTGSFGILRLRGSDSQAVIDFTKATSNTVIGFSNTGVGLASGAGGNTLIGYQVGAQITTGDHNVAIGQENLSQGNCTGNTAVGYRALQSVSTGIGNVGIGRNAADSNQTGHFNIGIGQGADLGSTAASNRIVIGHDAAATADNQTVIGNTSQTEVIFGGTGTKISGSATSTGSFGRLEIDGVANIGGKFSLPEIPDVSASLAAAVAGGDNLGNHTATRTLDLDGNSINDALNITASGDVSFQSNLVVAGRLTAQEYHTEIESASIVYSSGSTLFGNTQDDIHTFTGSLKITGSVTALNLTADSSSFSTRITNLKTDSGSFSTRLTTAESELGNTLISGSAQIATYVSGAFTDTSSSLATRTTNLETDSGSFSTRTTNLETDSGSFSTRTTNLETDTAADSGSFSTRTTNLETDSGSFSTRITNLSTGGFELISGSSTSTGSFGHIMKGGVNWDTAVSSSAQAAGFGSGGGSDDTSWKTGTATLFSGSLTSTASFGRGGVKIVDGDLETQVITRDWDLSTVSLDKYMQDGGVSDEWAGAWGIAASLDGKNVYVSLMDSGDLAADSIVQYEMSSSWDIGSRILKGSKDISSQGGMHRDMTFSPDGMKMITIDTDNSKYNEYNLTKPWDITTLTYVQNATLQGSSQQGITARPDGLALYQIGEDDKVLHLSLTTPWDVSTISVTSTTVVSGDGEGEHSDIFFRPDGRFAYLFGKDDKDLHKWKLSTPWLFSTATYTGEKVAIANNIKMWGNPEGTRLFGLDYSNERINQYSWNGGPSAHQTSSIDIIGKTGISGDTIIYQNLDVYGKVTGYDAEFKGDITGSATSTGSFGHIMKGGVNWDTAVSSSAAAAGFGGGGATAAVGTVSGSAQLASAISGAFYDASSSLATRLTTAESELGNTLISGSAQIATYVSGAFHDTSSSLATRTTNLETDSGSFSTRTTNLETSSGSFSTRITNFSTGGFELISGSATSTGSFGTIQMPGISIGNGTNTFFGKGAGEVHGNNGANNLAIGLNAMDDTDAGSTSLSSDENVFVGHNAGGGTWANNKSRFNVGIGNNSMAAAFNAALSNTALGYNSLNKLTEGSSNIAMGSQAGEEITTGDNNVCIGTGAGKETLATGNGNVLLGRNTDTSAAGGANQIVIGTDVTGTGDNQTIIGNSSQTHVIFGGDALISGSATSTGSFGHIMKGGVNWDTAVSASAATAGFGGGGATAAVGTVSGSAQLASAISGAFYDASSSLATRTTNLETDSGSFSTRVTTLENPESTTADFGGVTFTKDSAGTSWDVEHDLNSQYPNVTVYDSNDQVIIPKSITANTISSSTIVFDEAISGKAHFSVGGNLSGSLASTGSFGSLRVTSPTLTVDNVGSVSGSITSTGSFGQVKGTIVGQRPTTTHVSNFTASMAHAGHYNIVGGNLTCSILAEATASVDINSEFEFFQTSSAGNMLFVTASLVTFMSKSGNMTLDGQYAGASLKKVGTNTWHLVGDIS